jgi:hypothetical protein
MISSIMALSITKLSITALNTGMPSVITMNVIYADCRKKHILLRVVILIIIMLNVVAPNQRVIAQNKSNTLPIQFQEIT